MRYKGIDVIEQPMMGPVASMGLSRLIHQPASEHLKDNSKPREGGKTTRELSREAGVSEAVIRNRIRRGWSPGRAGSKTRKGAAAARSSTQVVALKLALAYPDDIPTVKQIMALHPMCKSSAERWRNVYREARERLRLDR